ICSRGWSRCSLSTRAARLLGRADTARTASDRLGRKASRCVGVAVRSDRICGRSDCVDRARSPPAPDLGTNRVSSIEPSTDPAKWRLPSVLWILLVLLVDAHPLLTHRSFTGPDLTAYNLTMEVSCPRRVCLWPFAGLDGGDPDALAGGTLAVKNRDRRN